MSPPSLESLKKSHDVVRRREKAKILSKHHISIDELPRDEQIKTLIAKLMIANWMLSSEISLAIAERIRGNVYRDAIRLGLQKEVEEASGISFPAMTEEPEEKIKPKGSKAETKPESTKVKAETRISFKDFFSFLNFNPGKVE
ncbi:hypothetical protein KKF38_01955 [Patescibacteria group bacterium]|nr:hypothetical protein [Patescibacteria group bacterium]